MLGTWCCSSSSSLQWCQPYSTTTPCLWEDLLEWHVQPCLQLGQEMQGQQPRLGGSGVFVVMLCFECLLNHVPALAVLSEGCGQPVCTSMLQQPWMLLAVQQCFSNVVWGEPKRYPPCFKLTVRRLLRPSGTKMPAYQAAVLLCDRWLQLVHLGRNSCTFCCC